LILIRLTRQKEDNKKDRKYATTDLNKNKIKGGELSLNSGFLLISTIGNS
jgi:hypothetical protein